MSQEQGSRAPARPYYNDELIKPAHPLRHGSTRGAQQRRIPSPLQTFERARTDFDTASSPRSPRVVTPPVGGTASPVHQPSSPLTPTRLRVSSARDKVDPAFEAVKAAASRDALLEQTSAARPDAQSKTSTSAAEPPSVSSSPSVANVASAVPQQSRFEGQAVGHRTASMESSMSLGSAPSQSFRAPPAEAPENVDIPALIAASGSPEAAIRKLLQEKQSASTHNAQLWRLVEKQRAMIFGLNKDMERATRDKERYRKKLKEHLVSSSSMATITAADYRASGISERDESQSPAVSEAPSELPILGSRKTSDDSEALQADRSRTVTPQQTYQLPGPSPLSSASPMHATPIAPPFSLSEARSPSFGSETTVPRANGLPKRQPSTSTPPQPQPIRSSSQTSDAPQSQPSRPDHPPRQLSRQYADSPTSDSRSAPQERVVQASRKAPPAPLDLSPQSVHKPSFPSGGRSDYHSSSDYEEDQSSGSAQLDRGRRQTRPDDDHDDYNDDNDQARQIKPSDEVAKAREVKDAETLRAEAASPDPSAIGSGCATPEEPGSPHVAQVQTYQSLNSINAVLRTPKDAEFGPEVKRTVMIPPLRSPGLPISPRPVDRPINTPALVPRAPKLAVSVTGIPMSPRGGEALSPRAPRQPIPMPPQTPLSISSPHLIRAENHARQALQAQRSALGDDLVSSPVGSLGIIIPTNLPSPGDIYRGLVSEQYSDLLLPPNALPSIIVKVDSSRLRPSRYSYMAPKQSEENPVFTLAVYSRAHNSQLWRVEKTLAALGSLDTQLKSSSGFRTKLPDRSLFTGHAPARIDARRSALGLYFDSLLDTPLSESAALIVCSFFSADAIGADVADHVHQSHEPTGLNESPVVTKMRTRKDGYLTKKGKNFGGWKARYFVVDGPNLKYFEAPGGAQLGAIKLQQAQVGSQAQQTSHYEEDVDEQYRHAFLILEPKKKDSNSHVRHVLCAESDEERDSWVECLLQYVEVKQLEGPKKGGLRPINTNSPVKSPRLQKSQTDVGRPGSQAKDAPLSSQGSSLKALSYNDTATGDAPTLGPGGVSRAANDSPSPTPTSPLASEEHNYPSISAPKNGAVIANTEAWGNKHAPNVLTKERDRDKDKERKRSIFAFRGRSSSETVPTQANFAGPPEHLSQPRPVFGVPLAEVCEFAAPLDVPVYLPAVVYRSIEYLRAKNAVSEEGIFRLSGSSVVIKALRERFNSEGDVKLLSPNEQYYDIHAVASLLKLYLRELPASILTRELHLDFLKGLELGDAEKIETLNVLVNRLPRANRELLDGLSEFLKEIVDNEKVNKMSVRNVGIVFAPTLNIPAPLISLFVTDYKHIFGPPIDISTSSHPSTIGNGSGPRGSGSASQPTLPAVSLRSPRNQMFPELSTHTYNTNQNGLYVNGPSRSATDNQLLGSREDYDTGAGLGFMPMQHMYDHARALPQRASSQRNGAANNSKQPFTPTRDGYGREVQGQKQQDQQYQQQQQNHAPPFQLNVGFLDDDQKTFDRWEAGFRDDRNL